MAQNELVFCPQCDHETELRDLWQNKGICQHCKVENEKAEKEELNAKV